MAVDLGVMDIPHKEKMVNVDCHNLVKRIDTMLSQFSAMPSATRSDWQQMDLNIVKNSTLRLEKNYELAKSIDNYYMPNYHPRELSVTPPPVVNRTQNADVQGLLDQLAALRGQLLFGHETAERTGGFHPTEKTGVYDPAFAKMNATIALIEEQQNSNPGFSPEVDASEINTNPGSPA